MQSRDEIAEQVVALAGSVGSEKAAKMRALVELARREGADGAKSRIDAIEARYDGLIHAHETALNLSKTISDIQDRDSNRIDDLEREAGMNLRESKLLAARVATLESSMSKVRERTYEIVREEMALVRSGEAPHARATTNTEEDDGEHAASVSRSVSAKDASRATTPNNAEKDSAMRHGSGARPDATSSSPAPSASEIPAWVPSAREIGDVAGKANTGSWYRHGDECYEAVRRLIADRYNAVHGGM